MHDLARASTFPAEPSVSLFEAIRVLSLRLAGRDLSTLGGVRFVVQEARGRPGWTVACDRSEPVLASGQGEESATIELRIKSDVGALELAGVSMSRVLLRRRDADVRRSPSGSLQAIAPTVEIALADLRDHLATHVYARVQEDVAELRRRGVEFDMGAGWGQTVRHVDPTTIVVEAEVAVDALALPSARR